MSAWTIPGRLAAAAFLVAAWAAPIQAADPPGRPNILFIFTDDQSHRTVGCYPEAYPFARTPNIDKLAARGVRFTHASNGTWCMPSRVSMLTGKHAYAVESMRSEGKYPGATYDPAKCRFWPAAFRKGGYATAQIGKWHTGTDAGFGRDWDYQVVWNRPAHPDNATAYYHGQLLTTNGGKPEEAKGYSTDVYTDLAVAFINGKNRDAKKPWYLWLCYGGVHGPSTPADRHKEQFPGAKVPLPADLYPPRAGKPEYSRTMERWVKGADGEPARAGQGGKAGKSLHDAVRQVQQCASSLDEGVGRIVKALEESGQLKNTLVVFTSDQGFAHGQHGFEHKLAPYEANMRAPFIVSMPGTVAEGKVCEAPVWGGSLVPTFFRFAGLDLPWEMHGHDLSPLLKDPAAAWTHPVLMVHTHDKFGADALAIPAKGDRHAGVPWWVSLRQGRYKYIRTLEAGEVEELYDLRADPEELTNLAAEPAQAARLKELRAATLAELRRTGGAAFADKLPPTAAEKKP